MKLPNGANAVADIAKLRDYCLDMSHPEGRHKARVFYSVLGIARNEAEILRDRLLSAAHDEEATAGEADRFGERYMIDFRFEYEGRAALVRSAWIVLRGEKVPRLTTCYVLRGL